MKPPKDRRGEVRELLHKDGARPSGLHLIVGPPEGQMTAGTPVCHPALRLEDGFLTTLYEWYDWDLNLGLAPLFCKPSVP